MSFIPVIRGVREYHACIFKYFIINGKSKNTRVYCWLLNPHGKTPCLLLENWDTGCVKFLQLTMFSEMRIVFHSMQSLMTGLLSFKFIYLRFIYSVLCTYFCSFLLWCNISFCRFTTIIYSNVNGLLSGFQFGAILIMLLWTHLYVPTAHVYTYCFYSGVALLDHKWGVCFVLLNAAKQFSKNDLTILSHK